MFEGFIRNARTGRYNIRCSIDAHEKSMNSVVMMEAAVGIFQYHQIQQQKHWFLSAQP